MAVVFPNRVANYLTNPPEGYATNQDLRNLILDLQAYFQDGLDNPTFETITVTGLSTLNTVNASGNVALNADVILGTNDENTIAMNGLIASDIVFSAAADRQIYIADSVDTRSLYIKGNASGDGGSVFITGGQGTAGDGGSIIIDGGLATGAEGSITIGNNSGNNIVISKEGVIATFADSIQTASPDGGSAAPFRVGSYASDGVAQEISATNYLQFQSGATAFRVGEVVNA